MAVETHTPRQSPSTPTDPHPQHYDPSNGAYDGQLVSPDLVHNVPLSTHTSTPTTDLPKHKVGGPADRMEWLCLVMPFLNHRETMVLGQLVKMAKPDGTCYPSQKTIAENTGISDRSKVSTIITALVRKDVVRILENRKTQGRSSIYQLSGALTGWRFACPPSACHQRQMVSAVSGRWYLPSAADGICHQWHNGTHNPNP